MGVVLLPKQLVVKRTRRGEVVHADRGLRPSKLSQASGQKAGSLKWNLASKNSWVNDLCDPANGTPIERHYHHIAKIKLQLKGPQQHRGRVWRPLPQLFTLLSEVIRKEQSTNKTKLYVSTIHFPFCVWFKLQCDSRVWSCIHTVLHVYSQRPICFPVRQLYGL